MTGSRRYRKPLVSFEFGTRIYAPTDGEPRYQAVAPGVDGVQVSQKFTTEEDSAATVRSTLVIADRRGVQRDVQGA
ncbi:MAG: hypothetical protein V9F03_13785 [Microthrixaceae bacterium]